MKVDYDRVAPTYDERYRYGDPAGIPACLHEAADGAARVLRPGGRIAVIGMDPSAGLDRWYLYDYFPGTLEADRARYPSAVQIAAWMENAGLTQIRRGIAARIQGTLRGRDVYSDPILSKNGTSQLTLLSDEAFAAGMARIEAAVTSDEEEFVTDISLAVVTASR